MFLCYLNIAVFDPSSEPFFRNKFRILVRNIVHIFSCHLKENTGQIELQRFVIDLSWNICDEERSYFLILHTPLCYCSKTNGIGLLCVGTQLKFNSINNVSNMHDIHF